MGLFIQQVAGPRIKFLHVLRLWCTDWKAFLLVEIFCLWLQRKGREMGDSSVPQEERKQEHWNPKELLSRCWGPGTQDKHCKELRMHAAPWNINSKKILQWLKCGGWSTDQHLIVRVPPVTNFFFCTTNFSWLEIWGRRGLSCEHGMLAVCFCVHVWPTRPRQDFRWGARKVGGPVDNSSLLRDVWQDWLKRT